MICAHLFGDAREHGFREQVETESVPAIHAQKDSPGIPAAPFDGDQVLCAISGHISECNALEGFAEKGAAPPGIKAVVSPTVNLEPIVSLRVMRFGFQETYRQFIASVSVDVSQKYIPYRRGLAFPEQLSAGVLMMEKSDVIAVDYLFDRCNQYGAIVSWGAGK
jgi:hypothetical protein